MRDTLFCSFLLQHCCDRDDEKDNSAAGHDKRQQAAAAAGSGRRGRWPPGAASARSMRTAGRATHSGAWSGSISIHDFFLLCSAKWVRKILGEHSAGSIKAVIFAVDHVCTGNHGTVGTEVIGGTADI